MSDELNEAEVNVAALVEAAGAQTPKAPVTELDDKDIEIVEGISDMICKLVVALSEAEAYLEVDDPEGEAILHLVAQITEAPEGPDYLPSGVGVTFEDIPVRRSEDLDSWVPDIPNVPEADLCSPEDGMEVS